MWDFEFETETAARRVRHESNGKHQISELGKRVAYALALCYGGVHNIDPTAWKRPEAWANPDWVEVAVRGSGWSTFDGNRLTRLVVVCHEMGLRLEVEPANPRYLRLRFWQREKRQGGDSWEWMPSIEQQIWWARSQFDPRASLEARLAGRQKA